MDAALNRIERGTLAPILRALGFHSLEQIDCLESLRRVVLEVRRAAENTRWTRAGSGGNPFKPLFIVRIDSSFLIENPTVRRQCPAESGSASSSGALLHPPFARVPDL
jgi:hypothetical protein